MGAGGQGLWSHQLSAEAMPWNVPVGLGLVSLGAPQV